MECKQKKGKVTFLKQRERNEGSKKESVYRRDKHEKGEDKGKEVLEKKKEAYFWHNTI